MKEIIAYKTTDNKIFENAAEAVDHECSNDLKKELDAFIDKYGYIYGWDDSTTQEYSEMLHENWSEFCKLFARFGIKIQESKK